MNILIEKLRRRIDELRAEGKNNAIIINVLKEELHYVILNFIYNNPVYAHLIMYGGTLLRIAHNKGPYRFQRMSVDLDFQTDKKFNFGKFQKDLILYFNSTCNLKVEFDFKSKRPSGTDYAFIKFPHILNELGIRGGFTVLKIRFDVNYFQSASKFVTETIPITRDTLAFSIKTYHPATLMASKVGAFFLRDKRGIGNEVAECKPSDVYDLEWYMQQKIIPDAEYLKEIFKRAGKILEPKNVLELFDKIMLRVMNLDDALFKNALGFLFYDPIELDSWLTNWKQRFEALRREYDIFQIKKLHKIYVAKEFDTDNRYFHFYFETEPAMLVIITIALSRYWYIFSDCNITGEHRRKNIEDSVTTKDKNYKLTNLDYQYIGLFYGKIKDYLDRNDNIVLQDEIRTKLIRTSAENLNVKTEIWLDRRLLVSVHFEDLL